MGAVSKGNSKRPPSRRLHRIGPFLIHLDKIIGRGSHSTVRLGFHFMTCTKVAVKIIPFATLSEQKRADVRREIDILHRVDGHPNIIKLLDVYEDETSLYMFFEYKDCDLYHYIKTNGHMTEADAQRMLKQLADAVRHCHENNIVHRDIKLENILLDRETLTPYLADFGFATNFSPDKKLDKWCGSPFSVCPEILARQPYVGPEVDVWSLGTVFYACLCGQFPFQAGSVREIFKKTQTGIVHPFPSHGVSKVAQDLVRQCLVIDPAQRMTTEEMSDHPFWKDQSDSATLLDGDDDDSLVRSR